jgi:hypothetical protein
MTLLNTILKPMKYSANSNTASNYSSIFIYESELDYISRCILDYPDIETGGNLFGHYTKNGIPVVAYVIGPGKSAIHKIAEFRQEKKYLKEIYARISESFVLSEIGAWHSHHQLDLPHPSGGDVRTVMNGLKEAELDEFIIVIGNYTPPLTPVNAFVFENNPRKPYRPVEWHILKGISPYREKIEERYENMLVHPKVSTGKYEGNKYPVFEDRHWLSDKNNIEELKAIVNFIKQETKDVKVFRPEGDIVIDVRLPDQDINIIFPDTFPSDPSYIMTVSNDKDELISEEKFTLDVSLGISKSIIQNIKDKIV